MSVIPDLYFCTSPFVRCCFRSLRSREGLHRLPCLDGARGVGYLLPCRAAILLHSRARTSLCVVLHTVH